ncbi:DNA-directed RNA polymerase subunit H [Candidatus Bathyarchaeota archaeon]|nr:DNA-directed RNA polymerase subunit H [Candidatus Bathyarchaeota archaeon]
MSKKKEIEIFEHELVPKHSLLSQDEAKEVLARYRIKPYQLPHIKASDSAARNIKAVPGDVVKIIRKSSTVGEAIIYRYVIEG